MPIVKVSYKKLFSLGNYENESIGAESIVGPGRDAIGELKDLIAWVEARHDKTEKDREAEFSRAISLAQHRDELRELTGKLEIARDRWEKCKAFLAKHGIEVEDLDIPF